MPDIVVSADRVLARDRKSILPARVMIKQLTAAQQHSGCGQAQRCGGASAVLVRAKSRPRPPRHDLAEDAIEAPPSTLPPFSLLETRAFDYTAFEDAVARLDDVARRAKQTLGALSSGGPPARNMPSSGTATRWRIKKPRCASKPAPVLKECHRQHHWARPGGHARSAHLVSRQ
jgi:hypothetical protein